MPDESGQTPNQTPCSLNSDSQSSPNLGPGMATTKMLGSQVLWAKWDNRTLPGSIDQQKKVNGTPTGQQVERHDDAANRGDQGRQWRGRRGKLAAAHDWYSGIHICGPVFKDRYGRTLLLRGVNLGGNSKLPTRPNNLSSHIADRFFDHRDVSFVGRPFALEEIDEHLGRLRTWGLTFVRLLVPWEALEAKGPGIYDEEYIDFLVKILKKMPEYGLRCFIDPHQDLWSRFSGGSGAPGWTFEVANLDLHHFKETGAAYVHNLEFSADEENLFLWPTNYTKLASATMFTIFWAGSTFAPKLMYHGEPAQEFLQRHYVDSYCHLARRIVREGLDAVVGFEIMNEPHQGYIGLRSMQRFDPMKNLMLGDSPSALQSFALGDAIPQEVEVWVKSWPYPSRKARTRTVNSEQLYAWLPSPTYTDSHVSRCLWRAHGVWDLESQDRPIVLKPDYFYRDPASGQPYVFEQDFYLPFVNRFARAVRSVMRDAFIFVEPVPNEHPPIWSSDDQHEGIVYAPHWYDLGSVFAKQFSGVVTHDVQALSRGKNVWSATYFGLAGARKNYEKQVRNVINAGLANVGDKPCLVGECGIPFDMNKKSGVKTGDYTHHSNFLDAVIRAMESNLVNFSLWNYNTNNDTSFGDHWNGEDFSIYSSPRQLRKAVAARGADLRVPLNPVVASEVVKGTVKQKGEAAKAGLLLNCLTVSSSKSRPESLGSPVKNEGDDVEVVAFPARVDESPTAHSPLSPFDLNLVHFGEPDPHYHDHIGGRALEAVLRPYAAKIAGHPVRMQFELETLDFFLEFVNPGTPPQNAFRSGSGSDARRRCSSRSRSMSSKSRPRSSSRRQASRGKSGSPSRYTASSAASEYRSDDNLLTPTEVSVLSPLKLEKDEDYRGMRTAKLEDEGDGEGTEEDLEDLSGLTEIFIPQYHYGHETLEVQLSDGDYTYDRELQTLYYRHANREPGFCHVVHIGVVERPENTEELAAGSESHDDEEEEDGQGLIAEKSAGKRPKPEIAHHRRLHHHHSVQSAAHSGSHRLRRRFATGTRNPQVGTPAWSSSSATTHDKQKSPSVGGIPATIQSYLSHPKYKLAFDYYEHRRHLKKKRKELKARGRKCWHDWEALCAIL